MLNIPDPWVFLAFVLSVGSALLCLVWGISHWNKEEHEDEEPPTEIAQWAQEENKVEEKL